MWITRAPLHRLVLMVICFNLNEYDVAAQNYPLRAVRIIVGTSAGSGADVTARTVFDKLGESLGQPMVVENRAGASGAIAAERVATSPPNGYVLLLLTGADTVQPALRADLPYDLLRDFAPVSALASGPLLLVVYASLPARDIKELIALAKSRPGKLSFGSTGVGTTTHLAGELFNYMAKVSVTHVPYKGGAESAAATAGGQIEISFPSIPAALSLIDAGKLRALAVSTTKRATFMPAVPTLNESGLSGYDRSSWYGVVAPAAVSRDIIARLNGAISNALNTPEMKETFGKQGTEPLPNTPEQFAAYIKRELAQNTELIKQIGAKAQ